MSRTTGHRGSRKAREEVLAASWHSSQEVGHGPRQQISTNRPKVCGGRAGRHGPLGLVVKAWALEPADVEPSLNKSLLMPAVGIMQS